MSRAVPGAAAVILAWLVLAGPSAVRAGEETRSLVLNVRLERPAEQLERLLDLFQGSPAPHPAAALAMWRQATGDPEVLTKTEQALIAVLNPEMVQEFRTLDGASISLDLADDGRLAWRVAVPHDDGAWAALGAAAALTQGATEPPLDGGAVVDRLGPPGSWLMARQGSRLVVAADREALTRGLARLAEDRPLPGGRRTGVLSRLDPSALARAADPTARRIGEGLVGLGLREIQAQARFEADALVVQVSSRLDPDVSATATIDPSWLDAIPSSGVSAALAVAIDPGPASWDRLFTLADRIEKLDPARADAAPLRPRLNLLAGFAGARPEVDLWPHLRGVSGFLMTDDEAQPIGALIALHATDEASAVRWIDELLPRLARAFGARPNGEPGSLGRIASQPLSMERLGATVRIGWGVEALGRSREALGDPARSAGPGLRNAWGDRPIQRFGAAWPDWALPALKGQPLGPALRDSPPLLWWGEPASAESPIHDWIRWDGLSGTIRRALEHLPLESPP